MSAFPASTVNKYKRKWCWSSPCCHLAAAANIQGLRMQSHFNRANQFNFEN